MLFPNNFFASCPKCGDEIELPTAAMLQSEQLGVSCECASCSYSWIYSNSQEPLPNQDKSEEPHVLKKPYVLKENLQQQLDRFTSPVPTVFVVEDDQPMQESLARLLKSEQFNIGLYCSSENFLQNCEVTVPGCLLLDLILPGMSGIGLLQKTLRMERSLPVIMMSAYADVQKVALCYRYAAFDFLEKPFNPNKLFQSIRKAFDESYWYAQSIRPQIQNHNTSKKFEYKLQNEIIRILQHASHCRLL